MAILRSILVVLLLFVFGVGKLCFEIILRMFEAYHHIISYIAPIFNDENDDSISFAAFCWRTVSAWE